MATRRIDIKRKFKRCEVVMVFTREPHMNPTIQKEVFMVTGFDADIHGKKDGRNFDERLNKMFDSEKQWTAAINRAKKIGKVMAEF